MNNTRASILPYIILGILAIPLFFMNIYNVHGWGDDFAQYIREAFNIANGRPYYESEYIFNPSNPDYGPAQYPAGFPLLLAPVVKIWGVYNFKVMMYFITLFLAGLLFILYAYFRKYTGTVAAICLSLMCVYAGGVLEMKPNVLSDIPSWFFIALYLLLREHHNFSTKRVIALVLCLTMAIMIRSQAILIVAAEILYLFIELLKKYRSKAPLKMADITTSVSFKITTITILLFIVVSRFIFAAPNSTMSYYQNLVGYRTTTVWKSIGESSNYFLELILRSFHYYPSDGFMFATAHVFVYMVLAFAIIGFIATVKKGLSVSDFYFILLTVFMLYFSQRQGVRFILSILPIYLLYAYRSAAMILPGLFNTKGRILAILITIYYIALGYNEMERSTRIIPEGNIPSANDEKAFAYLRNNISDSDVIIFAKPRALCLFTHKRTMVAARQLPADSNKVLFSRVNAKYILINAALNDEFYHNYLNETQAATDSISIADGYMLYRLK